MGDITNPRWIYIKGFLFLLAGLMASLALLLEHPTFKVALLLGLAVWCFARFYYFAFYVIEHYVDGNFKFAGLGAFCLYLIRRRNHAPQSAPETKPPPDQGESGS
ncbi:MAG TPA: hypothetical protein VKU00_27800 [Chthonomonadaceae bacterium]|nr:hypothetical protein [Chthonomonadaceae bacterium]